MVKILENMKAFFNNYDDEDYVSSYIDDEDMFEDEIIEEKTTVQASKPVFQDMYKKEAPIQERTHVIQTRATQEDKIVDFNRIGTQQVVVVKPEAIEDGQVIANEIRAGRVVLCNFEDLDHRRAQRIIDFLSGSAFSLGGKVMPISNLIYVITPLHIQLRDGLEEKEELKSINNLRQVINAY